MTEEDEEEEEEEDDDDYVVGYCRPPKQYQWPKGTSGFPTGRKKRLEDFAEIFRRVANRKTKIVEGGRARTVTMIEAAIRAPLTHALNGNRKSSRYVLDLMEEYGVEDFTPLYQQKVEIIYYDYERKLVINERLAPRDFPELYAECERRNPEVAKEWYKKLIHMVAREIKARGKN